MCRAQDTLQQVAHPQPARVCLCDRQGFCVFDFGDPSATFGVTMSWDISIDRPTWIDDGDDMLNGQYFDDDDYYNDYNDNFGNEYDEYARKNFVAMLVVNYETCVWRRVFITGPDGSYSASYSEEVCAAPRKYIRWVSFTGHPSELNAEAEVRVAREPRDDSSAAGSDDGSEGSGDGEGAGHCDADTVVPRVLFLSDSEEWVSSEAQERSPDVRLDGTNYWLLNNDDNSRHFLRSAAGRITKGHCHPRPQGGPVKQRGAPPDAMYAAGTYPS